jgi:hypothetical protein
MKFLSILFFCFTFVPTVLAQKTIDTLNIESNYKDLKLLDNNSDGLIVKSEIEKGITNYFDGNLGVDLSRFKTVLGLFGYRLEDFDSKKSTVTSTPPAQLTPTPASMPTKTVAPAKPFKVIGTIGVSYWNNNAFLNLGGPSLKFNYKKMGIMLSFFPSLRTSFETPVITLTPILGAGACIYYKKMALTAPCYYIANKNIWVVSYGIAYLF